MNILVLGLGNILLSDEGVGVRVAETLLARGRLPEGVDVVDGGTSGMDLLETMMGRDMIVVVDAISSMGSDPGDIIRLDGEELDQFFHQRISPHQIGLSDVLATLKLMGAGPTELVLFGIVPDNMELGLDLTSRIAAVRDRVVAAVEDEIAAKVPQQVAIA